MIAEALMTRERPSVSVHLLPSLIEPGALRGGVAVVVDVLRATTVMVHALAAGCKSVIPCGEIDEARAVAASLPPGKALLGGERGGLPIAGFDLGNSPEDYAPGVCADKTLVITTTNGTRAILASLAAEEVLIGAFVNELALVERLSREMRPIHIVCAGTEGEVSFEDTLFAGTLIEDLAGYGIREGNDAAVIASRLSDSIFTELEPGGLKLVDMLSMGRGGHNVERIGLKPDLQAAAQLNRFDLVPRLLRDPLRIVREKSYLPARSASE